MIEKEPVYFKEFRKSFSEFRVEINERFEGIDGKFEGMDKKLDEIIENQEVHFEAIGELKVQVTGIEFMLKDKTDQEYVEKIEERTEKLEKMVFA